MRAPTPMERVRLLVQGVKPLLVQVLAPGMGIAWTACCQLIGRSPSSVDRAIKHNGNVPVEIAERAGGRVRHPQIPAVPVCGVSIRNGHLTNQVLLVYPIRVAPTTTSDLTRAVQLFHALSDETRLGIVEMLQYGERCVCDLQDELDAAQSRLSFHLKVLREAGLVTDRKEGKWSYYSIVPEALATVHDLVVAMRPAAPGRHRLPMNARCCG